MLPPSLLIHQPSKPPPKPQLPPHPPRRLTKGARHADAIIEGGTSFCWRVPRSLPRDHRRPRPRPRPFGCAGVLYVCVQSSSRLVVRRGWDGREREVWVRIYWSEVPLVGAVFGLLVCWWMDGWIGGYMTGWEMGKQIIGSRSRTMSTAR